MLYRSIKRLTIFTSALIGTLLLFASLPLGDVVSIHRRGSLIPWLVLGFALSVIVRLLYWERISQPLATAGLRLPGFRSLRVRASRPHLPPQANPRDFATFAKDAFKQRFAIPALATLFGTVADPGGYVTRITEEVDLAEEKYKQRLSRTIRAAKGELLLPVLRPRKGTLLDEFRVTIDGQPASTLSYVEGQGAMLMVAETMFNAVYPPPSQTADHQQVFGEMCDALVSDAPLAAADVAALTGKLGSLTWANGAADPQRSTYRDVLIQLAGYLSTAYYVIVPIRMSDAGRAKVMVARTECRRSRLSRSLSPFRVALGLNVPVHRLELAHSVEAASYHLRTEAPEGMYIYRASLKRVDLTEPAVVIPATASATRPRMPALRTNEAEGLDYLHVYARDLDGLASDDGATPRWQELSLQLELREKPPGMLLNVLLLSGYLFALTWAVGHYHGLIFPRPGGHSAASVSGWPTILFGIPALISGWLLARFSSDALRKVSLPTVACTLWLVANAAAAVGLAALKLSGPRPETVHIESITVHHATWSLLMLSTGCHFVLVVFMTFSRASRYLHRAARATAEPQGGAK